MAEEQIPMETVEVDTADKPKRGRAAKTDLQQLQDQLANRDGQIVQLTEQNEELRTTLKNLDAARPGATLAQQAQFDEELASWQARVTDLEAALEQAGAEGRAVRKQLDAALNLDSVSLAMDENDVSIYPLKGAVGKLPASGGSEPVEIGLFAKDISGFGRPGVLLVTVSAGKVVSVQADFSVVLSGSERTGYELKPSRR